MKNKQSRSKTASRLFKTILGFYPVMLPVTILCIIALVISLYSAIKEKRDQLGDE